MKQCSKCGELKEEDCFYTKTSHICKPCVLARAKEKYKTNRAFRDRCLEQQRAWRERNPEYAKELVRDSAKRYYEKNKKFINFKRNQKDKSTPMRRFIRNLRDRIRKSFKRGFMRKDNKSLRILGVNSFQELLEHLGPKPSGEVHLDHICPLSQARTKKELEYLWHKNNLRWLDAKENLSKNRFKTPEAEAKCLELLGREWIA